MSCQGPDGLKVICKLPDLTNVFVLLSQSVLDIAKSGVIEDPVYLDAFMVLSRLAKRIANRLRNLSKNLIKHRDHLVDIIKQKATDKERPMLIQKVTNVMQDLRQEMGKLAPKLQNIKATSRIDSNNASVQNAIRLHVNKEASLMVQNRAESSLVKDVVSTDTTDDAVPYRGEIPNEEEYLERLNGVDAQTSELMAIKDMFKALHTIALVDTSLMKLEQDISDFLTEILLLFQEEIVELKMLIRMCQASVTTTQKDKDKKMLNALKHVREYFNLTEDDEADAPMDDDTITVECEPFVRTWRDITNSMLDKSPEM